MKVISAVRQITLPVYLDPFFIGVVLSILGIVIGSRVKKARLEDIRMFEQIHIRPEKEINPEEDRKTHKLMYVYLAFGILVGLFFVLFYALPYTRAL